MLSQSQFQFQSKSVCRKPEPLQACAKLCLLCLPCCSPALPLVVDFLVILQKQLQKVKSICHDQTKRRRQRRRSSRRRFVWSTGNWNQSINMDYNKHSRGGTAAEQENEGGEVAAGAVPRCQSSSSTTTTTTRTRSSNIICWLCGHFDWQSLNSFCSASYSAPPLSPWGITQLCMTCNLTSCRLISSAQIWQKLMSLLIKLQIQIQIHLQLEIEIQMSLAKDKDTK